MPQVQRVLETAEGERLSRRFPREQVVEAIRAALSDARERVLTAAEDPPQAPALADAAARRLEASGRPVLRRVINATGVVLHTNLGRAPLPRAAAEAMARAADGYSNL
ncbi:MAG: L-seryl-tRNA(Sec) selenium transferase, partial [Alphaproteobacteria bacterium]|nr:L-seryl-tRNA(Sec) selenium transferase [Alphaproteobacteria bacterium]